MFNLKFHPLHNSLSIRYKYLLYLTLLIIPLIIVPFIGIKYSSYLSKKNMTELYNASLQQVASGMDFVIDDMIASSNLLAIDSDILNILNNPQDFDYSFQKTDLALKAFRKVESACLYSYDVDFILLDMNGNIYSDINYDYSKPVEYEDVTSQLFFKKIIDQEKTFFWVTDPEDFSSPNSPFDDGFTLARLLFYNNTKQTNGVLIIHISPNQSLENLLYSSTFKNLMNVFIVDIDGNTIISTLSNSNSPSADTMLEIISSNQSTALSFDNDTTLFLHQKLNKLPWYIVGELSYQTLMKDYNEYSKFQISINLFFLFLTFLASFWLSGYIAKPIRQTNIFIKNFINGDFSKRLYLEGSYEFQTLSQTINSMLDEITRLMQDIEVITREKERARTKFLLDQLTPHFLLNTLNGIKWLCKIEGAKTSEKMIISLGYLLERTLNTTKEFVTISDEVKYVQHYVDLQHMRYGHKFQLKTVIEEETINVPVPILILQPLVENCILHAFEDIDYIGIITIHTFIKHDILIIHIDDNGIGIRDDWHLQTTTHQSRDSIGLKNIFERIKFYYTHGNITIIPRYDKNTGTRVAIQIPINELKEDTYESLDC